ncbi:MAG: hypothetical protein Q9209_007567 [Squamulea sp. 1 TL-2023]
MGDSSRVDTIPAYELIQRSRSETHAFPTSADTDDDFGKRTSKLPPKPLPGRSKYRPFILATLTTILNVVSLAIFIGHVKYLIPNTYWYGLELTGTSCDLANKQHANRWQSVFQINLRGAAHLSFGQAKFIDLVFDLVVGQGGRLLLAAVSYIVFMDALLRSMEITPVSYKLYSSLVFSSTSLAATWHATKAVFSTKGWRAKMYLTWCALAMIYVLAFPTLIESVTGYVSPSSLGFSLPGKQFITADSDELKSCFNVTNATLIGFKQDNVVVPGPPAHIFDASKSGHYETGFSSIVLYIILGLQLVWTIGMYLVWLDANIFSALVKAGRTIRGPFRAAADLAEVMSESLGSEYCAYTDKEIEKELDKLGNTLQYNSTMCDNEMLQHVGLTAQPGAGVLLSRQKLYGAEQNGRRRNNR